MVPTGTTSKWFATNPRPDLSIEGAKGVEDTECESIQNRAPAYESYTFQSVPEGTQVVIDQDVTEEFESYMNEAWPKALARPKALCEGRGGPPL